MTKMAKMTMESPMRLFERIYRGRWEFARSTREGDLKFFAPDSISEILPPLTRLSRLEQPLRSYVMDGMRGSAGGELNRACQKHREV